MKADRQSTRRSDIFRRLNTQYRVVFIDEDTLEEVSSYNMTMGKLYIVLSTIFVVIVLVTVSITLVTPLKYYIPGYGSDKARMQVIRLKHQVDSLSDLVNAQQKYEQSIRDVITGEVAVKRDTAMLNMKKLRQDDMNNMVPQTEIKKDAMQTIREENRKKKKQ